MTSPEPATDSGLRLKARLPTFARPFPPRQHPPCYATWLTAILIGTATPALLADPPILQAGSEIEYPPFCIGDARGQADGLAVELLRATANAMGRRIQFAVGPWTEVKQSLIDDRIADLNGRAPADAWSIRWAWMLVGAPVLLALMAPIALIRRRRRHGAQARASSEPTPNRDDR